MSCSSKESVMDANLTLFMAQLENFGIFVKRNPKTTDIGVNTSVNISIKEYKKEKKALMELVSSGCPDISLEGNLKFKEELDWSLCNYSFMDSTIVDLSVLEKVDEIEKMSTCKQYEHAFNDEVYEEIGLVKIILVELEKLNTFILNVKDYTGIIYEQ